MDAYYTTPLSPFAPAIGASFASFTTRQEVSALPDPILPANALRPGTILKLEAEGEFSTTGTPTLALGFFLGVPTASGGGTITSILAESGAITTASGAAAFAWRLEYRGKVTGIGSAGSITGCGTLELGTSLTAQAASPIPVTAALRTVALSTIVANAIGVCATWNTSSPSNAVKTYNLSALLVN
jgi:hypothetical protein